MNRYLHKKISRLVRVAALFLVLSLSVTILVKESHANTSGAAIVFYEDILGVSDSARGLNADEAVGVSADAPGSLAVSGSIITGRKFNDLNGNGVDDAEPGLAGWTIFVDYDDDGFDQGNFEGCQGDGADFAEEPCAITTIDGSYTIMNVPSGIFKIREVPQDGWNCSYPKLGDEVLPIISNRCYYPETVTVETDLTGIDFGNWQYARAAGYLWEDRFEPFGVWDQANEPTLIGWTLELWDLTSGLPEFVSATSTNGSGYYEFSMVGPGRAYVMCELIPSSYIQTYPMASTTPPIGEHIYACSAEIAADYGAYGYNFNAESGGIYLNNDFGNIDMSPNAPPTADPNGPYVFPLDAGPFDGTGSSDPDGDALTFDWDWGDGSISQNVGAMPSHTYLEAGIYDVCLTVDDGRLQDTACTYVVIYDTSAGFVTGSGWINSNPGSYVPDPSLEGKATFGFVASYKKGSSIPDGNTEFQFRVADLNFHSTSYQWLVVAGDKAIFKGVGTINNSGPYNFMIWADDGEPDTFRIKIWYEAYGEEVIVYDNGAQQALDGGSIIIHSDKVK